MKVVIFGATGFVGWAVLHEALAAPGTTEVVSVGRRPVGVEHTKLREVIVQDLGDLSSISSEVTGVDACFWCLGTSSQGMDEVTYTRITYAYAVDAARMLADANPGIRFCFVSGEGADGKSMWARVKKRTENALFAMPELRAVALRPAFIRASHGARLRGWTYRIGYGAMLLLSPLVRPFGWATSGAEIGRAMIVLAGESHDGAVFTSGDINRLAGQLATGATSPSSRPPSDS